MYTVIRTDQYGHTDVLWSTHSIEEAIQVITEDSWGAARLINGEYKCSGTNDTYEILDEEDKGLING